MTQVELLVAADLYGTKVNIKFVFPARPTLKEFITQVELAFRKEAVLQRPDNAPVQQFEVSSMQVFSEDSRMWSDVVRQGQLQNHAQYYAFQARKRGRSGSRTRSPSAGRRSFSNSRRMSGGNNQLADDRQVSRETHAERTATNDKRYCIFKELAPDGRLHHDRIPSLLYARGVPPLDIEEIQCALSGMGVGADGKSSFAQFSRFMRMNPKISLQLFSALGAEWVRSPRAVPQAPPTPPPPRVDVSSVVAPPPVAPVSVLDMHVREDAGRNDAWLQAEMRKLDEEYLARVREVKERYQRMEHEYLAYDASTPQPQPLPLPLPHQSIPLHYENGPGLTPARRLPMTSPPPPPPTGSPLNPREEAQVAGVYSQLTKALSTGELYSPPVP
eukprot:TRINITY_DN16374_c0_g1_i1.p1 TRINITY_DN16374_c0_g1~~TRINITY_DN16374_c0_g1_i1.p1  ORF type:complete len:397 (+),score=92.28 TRINITY_DN16374_c0_g1_i1:32-1192(+)